MVFPGAVIYAEVGVGGKGGGGQVLANRIAVLLQQASLEVECAAEKISPPAHGSEHKDVLLSEKPGVVEYQVGKAAVVFSPGNFSGRYLAAGREWKRRGFLYLPYQRSLRKGKKLLEAVDDGMLA